jgi:hypothetical protein
MVKGLLLKMDEYNSSPLLERRESRRPNQRGRRQVATDERQRKGVRCRNRRLLARSDKRLARTPLLLARYSKDDQPPRSTPPSGYNGVRRRLHGAKSLTGPRLPLKYSLRRALEKIHD